MFTPGNVIYFPAFYFKNGNTSKPKYFIVLGVFDGKTIIASLPTSQNNAPTLIDKAHGCIDIPDRCFNCYAFEPERVICAATGFSFALPTFVYGNQVEDYDITIFEEVYPIEGLDYVIEGNLDKPEFDALLNCILKSASIKRGIRRLFN